MKGRFRKEEDQAQAIDNSSPNKKEVMVKEDVAESAWQLNIDYIQGQQEIDKGKWGADKKEVEQYTVNGHFDNWYFGSDKDSLFPCLLDYSEADIWKFSQGLYLGLIKETLKANPDVSAQDLKSVLTKYKLNTENLPIPFVFDIEYKIGQWKLNKDLLLQRYKE